MIEGLLIIVGVCLVVWGIRHMLKKPEAKQDEVKRPKMPPVRPPPPPRHVGTSIRDKNGEDVFDILDDLVGVVEDLANSVSSRKRHSKSSDDDTWGGIDYD